MKTKKAILASVCLLIIAGVLFAVGMGLLGWNFKSLDTTKYIEKTYSAADTQAQIKNIVLDTRFSVRIVTGETVAMKYYESEDAAAALSVENETLTLDDTTKYEWWRFFNFQTREIELTVPSGINLKIDSTNANIKAENVAFGALNLDVTNADIRLKNCTGTDLTIDTTNSNLALEACTFDSLTSKSTNDDVRFTETTIDTVTIDTTNLSIKKGSTLTVNKLSLDATNMTVHLTLSAQKSEYTISSETTNGHPPANQTGTDASKFIKINATNFSGSIDFAS